jgi:hypothetical protein
MRIMVVIGIYNLKPGFSIIISPGSLPIGSFPNQGHKRPIIKIIMPMIISVFLTQKYLYTIKNIFNQCHGKYIEKIK